MSYDTQKIYICNCAKITRESIENQLKNQQCSLSDLQKKLGCGIECGSCVPELQKLLGINAWQPAIASCSLIGSGREFKTINHYYAVSLTPLSGTYPEPRLGQNIIIKTNGNKNNIIERTYTIVDYDEKKQSISIIAKTKTRWSIYSNSSTKCD